MLVRAFREMAALFGAAVVLFPSVGPALDHHFAERQPDHQHVYFGPPRPDHLHPYQQPLHSHPGGHPSGPSNQVFAPGPGAPTGDILYLDSYGGVAQTILSHTLPVTLPAAVFPAAEDGALVLNAVERYQILSEASVPPPKQPPRS